MKTYIIEIDEKQLMAKPEQIFHSIKGVMSVKETSDKDELKPLSDEDWIWPGRPATDEEWVRMIDETERGPWIPAEESRKRSLDRFKAWEQTNQK